MTNYEKPKPTITVVENSEGKKFAVERNWSPWGSDQAFAMKTDGCAIEMFETEGVDVEEIGEFEVIRETWGFFEWEECVQCGIAGNVIIFG